MNDGRRNGDSRGRMQQAVDAWEKEALSAPADRVPEGPAAAEDALPPKPAPRPAEPETVPPRRETLRAQEPETARQEPEGASPRPAEPRTVVRIPASAPELPAEPQAAAQREAAADFAGGRRAPGEGRGRRGELRRGSVAAAAGEPEETTEAALPRPSRQASGEGTEAPGEPPETPQGQQEILTRLVVRFVLCGLLALALLALAVAPAAGAALPSFLDPAGSKAGAVLYLSLSLSLLLIEGAVGFSVAFLGIGSLFTLRRDVDSIASLAYYAALLVLALGLPSGSATNAAFGASAGLCVAFNFLGKIFHVACVRRALALKEGMEDEAFQAAALVEPRASALVMRPFKGTPVLLTGLKGKALGADAEALYAPTPADAAGRVLSFAALLAALLGASAAYFLLHDGLPEAAGVFATVCCAAAPLLFEAGVSVPFCLAGKKLAKNGAYLAGYGEISRFGGVDAVTVDAAQLFPKGTVRMLGVKSYGDADLAAAVLYAASVAAEGESPLAPALTGVFADTGHRPALRLCSEISYEDECGLCAVVDGRPVLLGNRTLLRHHGVEAPPRETELHHTENGHSVAYLAVDGALCAMFILDYDGGDEQIAALRRLRRCGIHALVCSTDPNITPLLLEEKFGVSDLEDTVLGAREMQLLGRACPPVSRAETAFSTLGGLAAAAYACVRLRGTFWAQAALQTVLALAGAAFVLGTLFTGAPQPAPLQVLGYQGLCALPVLLIMLRH